MKTTIHRFTQKASMFAAFAAAAIYFCPTSARAVNYAGNGNTGFGGTIGNGILTLTDDGTNISGHLTFGGGFNDTLVLYVDTGVAGGFTSTTNFSDQGDGTRKAISGVDGGNRSALAFTNGFTPKYALGISSGFGGLWQLASGGNNSLPFVTSLGYNNGNGNFSIPGTALGLTNGVARSLKIFGTYISQSAYRSTEAIAGNINGPFGQGWNQFFQTAWATYNFATPPPPTYPVKFSVDMASQIASGAFVPASDSVYCGGSFQTNPFAFGSFPLVRVGTSSIYTNTYADANPTNTIEQFKFQFISVANSTTNYDDDLNRQFTLKSGGQVVPLVYFNYAFPSPSATTNFVTFSVDMGPQVFLGNFDPSTMTVQALGTFTSPKWTAGFILTNNPNAANTNIYTGVVADGNYPGGFEQFKFVIATNGGDLRYENFQGGANRIFFTPTNSGVMPLAYFNGISSYGSTPITFQVDMTVPLASGLLNPGNGDTVSAAGTFQTNQWTPAVFTLDPLPGNPNIYKGTYIDRNQPSSGELFKFQINAGGVTPTWESSPDRTFLLGSTAFTNPLVYWSNLNPVDTTPSATTVTFSVNMTNAFDSFGFPFDPDNDIVMVDGDFQNPNWAVMSHATEPLISSIYSSYVLSRAGSSLIYTGTFTVSGGNALEVHYKYGIYHDTANLNTNIDNEAGFGLNHTRFIRGNGTYNFPVDTFGQTRTDLPGATEPSFGNLAIGQKSGGNFPISWLGRRGVRLQYSTNLANATWVDLNSTDTSSSTNWPATTAPRYFRLVKPQ
jgi:hypothetical protein